MFFGDKYGDEVRVVIIDENFSVELCGGTHVKDTSDIGLFKIVKEESISSGTRRIIARTGEGIIHLINEKVSDIEKIISDLPEKYSGKIKAGLDSFNKDFKGADFKDSELCPDGIWSTFPEHSLCKGVESNHFNHDTMRQKISTMYNNTYNIKRNNGKLGLYEKSVRVLRLAAFEGCILLHITIFTTQYERTYKIT